MIKVGAASVAIDTPPDTPMAGFAARKDYSIGVHDEVTARAIVFESVALVAVDCCALHEDHCDQLRSQLVDMPDLGLSEVVIHATHTHSGPGVCPGRLGEQSPALIQNMFDAVKQSVEEAVRASQDCELYVAHVRGVGVAKNRRHASKTVDPPLHAIVAKNTTGEVVATLVSYPCHPVVLDASNLMISADYPGFVRNELEEKYPHSVCVFLTGAAGDLNTGHRAEDSYVKSKSHSRTFEEAARIGRTIADRCRSAEFRLLDTDGVKSEKAQVAFPLVKLSEADVAKSLAEWEGALSADPPDAAVLRVWCDWGREWDGAPEVWAGHVTVIRLGDLYIVALPGEPFLSIADDIARYLGDSVIVLGYCDGVPGYFPSESEFQFGGYEVCEAHRYYGMGAPFASSSATLLVSAAIDLASKVSE